MDEQVLAREVAPFKQLRDNYPKYLLTMDEVGIGTTYDGIQQLNVLDWLMAEP